MILEKEFEITLNSSNIAHYKKLGYKIPMYKNVAGKYVVKRGTKIVVKIDDLTKGSHVNITKICDECGDVKIIRFKDMIKTVANGISLCVSCGVKLRAAIKQRHSIVFIKKEFLKKKLKPMFIEYTNNKQLLKYRCMRCGHIGKICYNAIQNQRGCSGLCFNYKLSIQKIGKDNPMYGKRMEKSPNWDSTITSEQRINRRVGIKIWRKEVYERDNYTCQCCKQMGVLLNAHHLNGYHWCKEGRLDVDNGITLCKTCHSNFHNKYGRKNNTKEQFEEFKNEKNTI